jgi:thiol-disulfide isomerase/thioredoxin
MGFCDHFAVKRCLGPCKKVAPLYAELSNVYDGTAILAHVDIDDLAVRVAAAHRYSPCDSIPQMRTWFLARY